MELIEDKNAYEPVYRFGSTSPYILTGVMAAYLLIIYQIGPRFMKNRAPYELKTFIFFYNAFQIGSCIFVIYKSLLASEHLLKFWRCNDFQHSSLKSIYASVEIYEIIYWLKHIELTETVVFVLRKKYNQVSLLHVFHHAALATMSNILVRKYKGLDALFPIALNSSVHVIMYTYYLLASVCDKETLKRFEPIKKSITIIQMVQFTLAMSQCLILAFGGECGIPKEFTLGLCIVIGAIFYGFSDFYKKSYNSKQKKKSTIS